MSDNAIAGTIVQISSSLLECAKKKAFLSNKSAKFVACYTISNQDTKKIAKPCHLKTKVLKKDRKFKNIEENSRDIFCLNKLYCQNLFSI